MELRADKVQPEPKMIDDSDTGNAGQQEINSAFGIAVEAEARRQQRVRFMRVCGRPNRHLADKLDNCDRNHRCKSESDPVCVALFQRKLYRAAGAIVAGRSWTRTSVVTSELLVPYGHLGDDLARGVDADRWYARRRYRRLVFLANNLTFFGPARPILSNPVLPAYSSPSGGLLAPAAMVGAFFV